MQGEVIVVYCGGQRLGLGSGSSPTGAAGTTAAEVVAAAAAAADALAAENREHFKGQNMRMHEHL